MKKIFLLAIGVLCCMYSAAQTHIPDRIDKKGLQDYVICEYVKAHCETYCKKNKGTKNTNVKKATEEYKKTISDELENNAIKSPVSHETLSGLLNNNWNTTKTNIVDELLNNNTETVEDILNINNCSFEDELKERKGELQNEICGYISDYNNNRIMQLANENENLANENRKLKEEKEELINGKGTNNTWLIMAFIVGVILCIIFIICDRKSDKFHNFINKFIKIDPQENNNENDDNDSNSSLTTSSESGKDEEIKSLEKEKKSLNEKIKSLEKEKKSLNEKIESLKKAKDNEINELNDKINELQRQLDSVHDPTDSTSGDKNEKPKDKKEPPETFKYLKTATKGVFNKSFDTNDGCYFKMFHIKGDKALFEFIGDEAYGIANEGAIFDGVCDIYGIVEAKHIKNEKPGVVQCIGDDQWKVVTKAKINFEA